ncbi:cytochrome d ubiquinol oxidase subunit II [Terrilactibacillus laevilacticus]|uniref:Cytochrome d ubiquinol oxidase subunit II n=1 Tax=Terrilactibacillus laevilacticus TaxID=1380157 RepID=A0ABW5PQC5_9BACI|nr:cytochrome d ubiquinol oxidase subunit II [Terrilactibacillus laevilacticus]
MLSLNELWFILVAILFIGFFFLEGFDFGVGMALRLLGHNDLERRLLINTIGPFWDANEVWLLTAGGATFAAFPNWYATMFSGFFIPLAVMLLALIGRGVAFEFRGKVSHSNWKNLWDWVIFFGSLLPPLLWGVAFSAILRGMPIDKSMNIHGSFTDYINVYTLIGGIAVTVLCLLHGLIFITLRTTGDVQTRARNFARKLIYFVGLFLVAFVVGTYLSTDIFARRGLLLTVIYAAVVIALVLAGLFMNKKRDGLAFTMTGIVIALAVGSLFIGLFPRVMISSISGANDLTIHNAASGPYSLKVMTIVSLTLLPFVLGYQIWSYYIFRKRVTEEHLEY